jgi:plasmid stabilization system protein ParE
VSWTVEVSRSAAQDVDRLEDWLLAKNPAAADRVRDVLTAALCTLAEHPLRGRSLGNGVRQIFAGLGGSNYVIRYRATQNSVVVTRIYHGRERR